MLNQLMSEAFLLGLSTGLYCAAACFPVAIPFLFSEVSGKKGSTLRLVGGYLLGRLLAYLLVGYLVGVAGQLSTWAVPPLWQEHGLRWLYGLTGIFMLGSGLWPQLQRWKHCSGLARHYRPAYGAVGYGVLTGANVCPPFVAAAAHAFGQTSGAKGMLYFVLFFLGTSVYFLPMLGIGWLQQREPMLQAMARVTLVLMGLYFLLVLGVMPWLA